MNYFLKFVPILALMWFMLSSESLADDPLKAGKTALEKGDYATAIVSLREATRKDKKNPEAFLLLGTALLRADSADQAVAALIQARELDSSNAVVYVLLGDSYVRQNFSAAAIEQYKRATEFDSTKSDVFLKLAEAHRKSRQYTDAARTYHKVLTLDSLNLIALRELGNIYMRAKQYSNAAPIYKRLYRLTPESLNVKILYVKTLYETKNYEELIPVAEEVLQRDASQSEVESMLAEAYNATGNTKKAVETYGNRNPDSLNVDDLIRYARALKAQEEILKAIDIYQKAYARDSARCTIPYDLGALLMKAKRYKEAVTMFEKKIACDTLAGYQFASHLNAAMCLMQLKEFDEAKDHILKSIEYRPDNILAWQTLAQDYALKEAASDKIAAYKKVIELATAAIAGNDNGDAGKYDRELGEAYRMIGLQLLSDASESMKKEKNTSKEKFAAAADYLKKALKFSPKDCELLFYTGLASQNSNNKEDAKRFYCKVIETCPKSKQAEDAKKYLDLLGETCGQ